MNQPIKDIIQTVRNLILPAHAGHSFFFVTLTLTWFALLPAQAQLPSPTPDGGYRNGNTAEGDSALFKSNNGVTFPAWRAAGRCYLIRTRMPNESAAAPFTTSTLKPQKKGNLDYE